MPARPKERRHRPPSCRSVAPVLVVQAALREPVEDGLRHDAPIPNRERVGTIVHLEALCSRLPDEERMLALDQLGREPELGVRQLEAELAGRLAGGVAALQSAELAQQNDVIGIVPRDPSPGRPACAGAGVLPEPRVPARSSAPPSDRLEGRRVTSACCRSAAERGSSRPSGPPEGRLRPVGRCPSRKPSLPGARPPAARPPRMCAG